MSDSGSNEQLAAHLRKFSPSPNRITDAGLRALSHYERRLPRWRHQVRQKLIPLVRWETPHLARLQRACRSPVLDSYFAFTANLGTHTFFMLFLPICFWCGHGDLGVALVHMLGLGVVLSGIVKDLLCLPRPLSPPLQRITMSGSAALEYGFPSTHTTNALSVALFCLYRLHLTQDSYSSTTFTLLTVGLYCYATSITLGRMYCGMHGFFDVVIGGILGIFIAWLRIVYGPPFDDWILAAGWTRPAVTSMLLALIVHFHPEPADNCPCFDDSVAFIGVIAGITFGTWHYGYSGETYSDLPSLAKMYSLADDTLVKATARVVLGVTVVFLWRALMKPLLLGYLPPLFRFVDYWGFRIPRRHFLQSRDYIQVPPMRKDDNVLPSASEIPSMLSSMRNPRRRRISVGPQSEADAREYLANRAETRKESGLNAEKTRRQSRPFANKNQSRFSSSTANGMDRDIPSPVSENLPTEHKAAHQGLSPTATGVSSPSLQVNQNDPNLLTPPASDAGTSGDSGREEENSDREMFATLKHPRTHYDVEVITKLVVYAGIAWLAVEGNPLLFQRVGIA